MSLPIIRLSGAPYERGHAHGRLLKSQVADNLGLYFDRFEHEADLAPEEVRERSRLYLGALTEQSSDYVDAMRGVADGSGVDLIDVVALNVRYELLYYQFGMIAQADGCTSFAVAPAASTNGHLLIGQNWDWIPGVRGAVVYTVESNGPRTLAFTEAGIVGGKIGLNSAGLGLAINGLTTTADDWSRLSKPFHLRCHEILRSSDLDSAIAVVASTERACSTNFLIAQIPERLVNLEAAPSQLGVVHCERDCLVHANHFVDPAAIGVVETPSERRDHSCHRQERLRHLLTVEQPVSADDLQRFLRDHAGYPNSVCRHEDPADPPDERYRTVISAIMDLHDRSLWIADGPPCLCEYQSIALGDLEE